MLAQTSSQPFSSTPPADRTEAQFRRSLAEIAPELYGRALRLSRCPAAAEDLVQDTVERALRFEGHYQQGTNLRAWVHQILFSVFVTRCRRARRERRGVEHLSKDPCAWTTPDDLGTSIGLSRSVEKALASLPASFRDAVVSVDILEMPYKKAAAMLGVPVGTVMSRLHRGRRMLAEALRPIEARSGCAPTMH